MSWVIQLYRSNRMENINHCIDSINCDLQKVDNWAKANGVYINSSKPIFLLLSRTKRAFVVPFISAINLGIIFNGRLTWFTVWLETYVINVTTFAIRMQLAKAYLIPVLLYESEIFANCVTDDRRKLNL